MKNPSERAELFHAYGEADGQTNRHDESKFTFCSFAKAPKN